MQHNRTSLAMFPVVAWCITAPALATLLAAGLMQGERISRPGISEQISPLEPIAPAARVAIVARVFFENRLVSDHFQSL